MLREDIAFTLDGFIEQVRRQRTEHGLYTRQDRDPAAVSRLSASTRCIRNSGDVSSYLDVPKEVDSVSTRNCRGKTAPNQALNSHFRRPYLSSKAGETPYFL